MAQNRNTSGDLSKNLFQSFYLVFPVQLDEFYSMIKFNFS